MSALQSKSVVIVGGSLTGLFHRLYLKRHGVDVTILEKDPRSIRSSYQAGIAFGPAVEELLAKYDDTGLQSWIPAVGTRFSWRKRQDVAKLGIIRHETSWTLLYNILRANFDGMASETVPSPPPARDNDGNAQYLCGQKVIELIIGDKETTRSVKLGYISCAEEQKKAASQNVLEVDYIEADLVIAADGLHSTMRRLLNPPGRPTSEYAGYVAWRGTVPENQVSTPTAEYITNARGISRYCIPPDSGSFTSGTRLINWVWYCNVQDKSEEMNEPLTSKDGHIHGNTLPSGLVRPEVWDKYLAAALAQVTEPFAELLAKTKNPFVINVNDILCEKASFYDGRVLLAGDALATFRPHFAIATEKAARAALQLGKVWEGKKTLEEWEKEVLSYEKTGFLGSRVLGAWGCRGWWEFGCEAGKLAGFLAGLKLAGVRRAFWERLERYSPSWYPC
ncbi:zeaxanthin epoxidase, chloroplastic [Rhypophila decipiens]|uniref:Zeaxanthin epoxidase, chloroplastic n=1 Tax=Rhypophila decipiens TaxID=261697 RepID=A0AAN6Y9T1_9PEZI|nr:zeaxanthin epoxidase, chloroplastic [Rhypophila decipiens]